MGSWGGGAGPDLSGVAVVSIAATALVFPFGVAVAPAQEITDEECLLCHAEPDVVEMAEEDPRPGLVVDPEALGGSVHAGMECNFCHEGIDDIPHAASLPPVDPDGCAVCHDVDDYLESVHGAGLRAGVADAAGCTDCHGVHDIMPVDDPESRVYPMALPSTCGECHGDQRLTRKHSIDVPDAYEKYLESAHGHAVIRAGLLVSATCNDCHGDHAIFRAEDPRSRIHRQNVPETCGGCHVGVLRRFDDSIHGMLLADGEAEAPTCSTCHSPHEIDTVRGTGFAAQAVAECGTCHADMLDTYRGTYHGKVNALGFSEVAACASCHTAHSILPPDDPASSVSEENRVATCAGCHPGANASFASYIVHADPTDAAGHPWLFTVYAGMLSLITLTLVAWGGHTLLWYRRLQQEREERGRPLTHGAYLETLSEPQVVRFNVFNRMLHILVMVSFLLLVATGLPIRFPDSAWAESLVRVLGGFRWAAWLHRFGAILTGVYVLLHLGYLAWLKWGEGRHGILFGSDSLLPRRQDWDDLVDNVRWFLGRGPRPDFGRWTYFEKFDYFADAWGVLVFGTTGLIMWYPVTFTRWLPGWAINVAVILHGFEALLALSFIFTIHFFNAHLRPGRFPMDPVFLTGRITLEELKEERPREYRRLVEEDRLEEQMAEPASPLLMHYAKVVGYIALTVGLLLIGTVAVTVLVMLIG